jgi:hypothetical protein
MVSMRRTPEKTKASIGGHGSNREEVTRQSPRRSPRLSGQPQPAVLLPSPPPGNNDADEEDDKEDEPVILKNAGAACLLSFDDDKESCGAGDHVNKPKLRDEDEEMMIKEEKGDEAVDEEEAENKVVEEDAQVRWLRLGRKSKSELSENDLHNYFDEQMKRRITCPNKGCNCLAILANANAHTSK